MQRFFEAKPESIGRAREFAAQALTSWGLTATVEDARLCVSELASNALVHGSTPGRGFLVRLTVQGDFVRLEVARQPCSPASRAASGRNGACWSRVTARHGAGRRLGVEKRDPFGKIVWARFKAVSPAGG